MANRDREPTPPEYAFVRCPDDRHRLNNFRFKSKSNSAQGGRDRVDRSHHSRPEDSHHRHKRRKVSPSRVDDSSAYDDSIHNLPPEAAFRESLFDALGDDEGAAFWEGVYGQPIHTYTNTYIDKETGNLERMTDEEYTRFVRRKMWEKSYEGIEALREERRRQQKEEAEWEKAQREGEKAQSKRASFDCVFDLELERSLRRGEERKDRNRWKALWETYQLRWEKLRKFPEKETHEQKASENVFLRNEIAWPVESGKRSDLSPEKIEEFFLKGNRNANPEADYETALVSMLKAERVKWHPDKIQQRYGSLGIDEKVMKGVTTVFQVVDRMWTEKRKSK